MNTEQIQTNTTTPFDAMAWITKGEQEPEKLIDILKIKDKDEMLRQFADVSSIYNKSHHEIVCLWLLASKNTVERASRYSQIADIYENITTDIGMMDGVILAAEYATKYIPKNAKLLDIAAGTGSVGKYLKQNDYTNLEALDISTGMLQKAQEKNAYLAFHEYALGDQWDFPTSSFDAAMCINMLPDPSAVSVDVAFDEPIRVIRSTGHMIFTLIEGSSKQHYLNKLDELVKAGKWKFIDKSNNIPAGADWTKPLTPSIHIYQII